MKKPSGGRLNNDPEWTAKAYGVVQACIDDGDPVIIHFPKLSHTPPRPMPTQPPIRERIIALYRHQGRPQAHLDRVMRLGRV